MKSFIIYLMFFSEASIILGAGTCGLATVDYCPEPVGKAAIEVVLMEHERHSVSFEAEHFSKITDGVTYGHGDRGTEIFFLQYKFKLFDR